MVVTDLSAQQKHFQKLWITKTKDAGSIGVWKLIWGQISHPGNGEKVRCSGDIREALNSCGETYAVHEFMQPERRIDTPG